jgi:tetratricopeptide (TPR) repeat protein
VWLPRLLITYIVLQCALFAQSTNKIPICNILLKDKCATPPRILHGEMERYLKGVHLQREGEIIVQFLVHTDGSVSELQIVRSNADSVAAGLLNALKHATFAPATYQDIAIPELYWAFLAFHANVDSTFSFAPACPPLTPRDELNKMASDAWQAQGRRDYRTAISISRRLIELAPFFPRNRLVLAYSLTQMNQLDEALSALEEETKLEPKSPYAYDNLGRVYWRLHKPAEALAEFQKQLEIDPKDHYAHQTIAVILRDEHRCAESLPEAEKALAISSKNPLSLLTHGECLVASGDTAKGMAEMEQATSTPNTGNWNRAAYWLADNNLELDRAQKWSDKAVATLSAQMHDISLEHVTANQMDQVSSLAYYWDTRGWIEFARGNPERARSYVETAWFLRPIPSIGEHLGQIQEKLGHKDEAVRTYAMAVASADLPTRMTSHPLAGKDASERLTRILPPGTNTTALIQRGRTDLEDMRSFPIPNENRRTGSGDFLLKMEDNRTIEVRQISGDPLLAGLSGRLQSLLLPPEFAEKTGIEIVRRATLNCPAQDAECHLTLLSAEESYEITLQESDTLPAESAD